MPEEADRQLSEAALKVRCAVHAGGLVGGVGLKPVDLPALRRVLAGPEGRERLLRLVLARIRGELLAAGIVYGLQEESLEAVARSLVDGVEAGSAEPIAQRVAQGEPPEPAQDGYIEYPLNHRGLPFAQLASLAPRSHQRKRTVVQAGNVLAVAHPPTPSEDGTSVRGDRLPAQAAAAARSVDQIAGPHTAVDGDRLLAECDGLCEEDADGWLRVVPEIVLPRVDQTTGRIPEAGLSEANVAVVDSVAGGPGIATAESVFVGTRRAGGTVEGHASIQARHLVVNGGLLGEGDADGARIEVDGYCVVRQVRNRAVEAAHILVVDDSDFGHLDAEASIRVDGTLRGGAARCGAFLEVRGDLGTEAGGSHTLIVAPAAARVPRRAKRAADLVRRHRAEVAELRKQLEDLDRRAQKRAGVDPYWARLVEGERPPPRGPVQGRTRAQFDQFHESRTALQRRIDANQRAARKLGEADEDQAEAAADGPPEIRVTVGGTLHLDVTFEVSRTIGADDGERSVSFALEGEHLAGRPLADVKAHLLQQVTAYREQQTEYLEERRRALEELHKGLAIRPEAPKMEDRTFALAVTWDEVRDGEEAFALACEVGVRALQPDEVVVRSSARVKAAVQNATVTVGSDGARGTFALASNPAPPAGWQADGELRQALAQVVIRGATALDALAGTAVIQA